MRKHMTKRLTLLVFVAIITLLNATTVEPGIHIQGTSAVNDSTFANLCNLLKNVRPTDLPFCLGYIKNSSYSNDEIANFILTWSADAYKARIPPVFRWKIDRVIKSLGAIDYHNLITNIDVIKNTQLTITEMVRLVKAASIKRK